MLLLPLPCQFLSFGDLVENYLSFSVILPSASMTNIFLVFLWEAVAEKLAFSPDSIAGCVAFAVVSGGIYSSRNIFILNFGLGICISREASDQTQSSACPSNF